MFANKLNMSNTIKSKGKSALTKPYLFKTAFPLSKQLATSIHAINTYNTILIILTPRSQTIDYLLILYNILLCLRSVFILSQNREDTVSQPRKNNDKYLRENNTFGKDLINKYK